MKTIVEFLTGIRRKGETIKSQLRYQCPMKCEGEKTYDAPGVCPVCNMKLVPVNNINSQNLRHHCC